MVFKDVRFTRDSEDDLVSFLEVATLVCLVSCLAELLADPDLARDVVFVIATLVFLELLPVAPTVLADAALIPSCSSSSSSSCTFSCTFRQRLSTLAAAAKAALSDSNLRIACPAERDSSTTPSSCSRGTLGFGATAGGASLDFVPRGRITFAVDEPALVFFDPSLTDS